MPSFKSIHIKKELILLSAVLVIAGVFLFHNIPHDMGDDAVTDSISAMLINRAHDTGKSAYEVFKESSQSAGSGGRYLIPHSFQFMGLGTPLWTSLLSLTQKFLGVTSFWQLLMASFLGFLTVLVTYYTGKAMYGWSVGILSALLIGTSLFFVIQTRTASGYLVIAPLMTVLVTCLFYTAHKKEEKRYLWYSGIALGFGFFNGYPTSFLLIPILGFFTLWNFSFRNRKVLLKLRDYLIMVFLAVSMFIALTIGWSKYANLPALATYHQIIEDRTLGQLRMRNVTEIMANKGDYFGITWLPKNKEWKIATEKRFWRVIFWEMDPWETLEGTHNQQQLAGRPMVAPFATVFFFIGILTMIWQRSMADKFCLVWLAVTKFAFTFVAGFTPRLLMAAAPVIYLTAAVGLMRSLEFLEKKSKNMRKVLLILIVGGLAFTAYKAYREVFHEYYGMDGNINHYVGTYELGRYIGYNFNPEDTILVLGEISAIPYDAIFLYTSGKPYKVLYWWDDILKEKLGGRGPAGITVSKLNEWEKEILKNKSNIIYIFATGARYNKIPGWNLYNQVEWNEFKELHPGLEPVKKVYFSNGIPASELYVVSRSTPKSNYLSVKGDNLNSDFYSSSEGYVSFIKIRGGGKNPTLSIGNNSFILPMDVSPSMEASISFDKNSRIIFEPLFNSQDYEKDIFEQKNLALVKSEDKSFLEMIDQSAYLIYKIESPFKIERLDIRTDPRLFNDKMKKNIISASYSTDNKEYKKIYEVRSDGSGHWAVYRDLITGKTFNNGIYERETYSVIYPDSNVVYIKFNFEGFPKEAQFWSRREDNHWLMFDARVDTSSLKKPEVKKGLNTLRAKLDRQGEVIISTADATIMPRVLEAEYLSSSTGMLDLQSYLNHSNGIAVKANGSIHPPGYVVYGPGLPLGLPGIYEARFKIAVFDNSITESVARIEVSEDSDVLEETEIKGTDFSKPCEYRDFYLKFKTDGKKNMQYRVFFERGHDLWIDFIEVQRKDLN